MPAKVASKERRIRYQTDSIEEYEEDDHHHHLDEYRATQDNIGLRRSSWWQVMIDRRMEMEQLVHNVFEEILHREPTRDEFDQSVNILMSLRNTHVYCEEDLKNHLSICLRETDEYRQMNPSISAKIASYLGCVWMNYFQGNASNSISSSTISSSSSSSVVRSSPSSPFSCDA